MGLLLTGLLPDQVILYAFGDSEGHAVDSVVHPQGGGGARA